MEAWEKWEHFGAYYYALRLNAFLLLGYSSVTIGRLLGPSVKAHEEVLMVEVCLRPAKVFFSQNPLSTDMDLGSIDQRAHMFYSVSAFDLEECFVFCNGTNGAGVDIFFALKAMYGGGYVLITDQRKLDCKPLTTVLLQDLSAKAKAVFPAVENIKCVVFVICSALANFVKRKVNIPGSCVAMGRDELFTFHGPLSRSVAAFARANINIANQTWLSVFLFNNNPNQAKAFINQRKLTKITFSKLSEFVKVYSEITSNSFPLHLRELLLLDDDLELQTSGEDEDENEDEDAFGDKDEESA
jgi:hypothetical protein